MAARSALAMLSRRSCGFSGSSAGASMGGRGLEIPLVLCPAAQRTSALRPAAFRNLESWRRFSTEVRGPADQKKAESVLRMWWQRSRNRVKNASMEERARAHLVYTVVAFGTLTCYVVTSMWDLHRWR